MSEPVGITVISSGLDDVGLVKSHLEAAGEDIDDWYIMDVRDALPRDPASRVGHKEDGKYPQTQRAVVGQSNFVELILFLVCLAFGGARDIERAYSKFYVHCRTGFHRASTCGAFLAEVLNYITDGNARVFNAQLFPLHGCYDRDLRSKMLNNALSWASLPWNLRDGGRRTKMSLYAYEACMLDPTASSHWHGVYNTIDTWYPLVPHPPCEPPIHQPPPPPPAPDRSSSSSYRAPARASEQLPDWATFEKSPRVWWELLDQLGCDRLSRRSLFCLAQFSDDGYEAANSALSKLVKKQADNEDISNASALLHTLCKNARHVLDPRFVGGEPVCKKRRSDWEW